MTLGVNTLFQVLKDGTPRTKAELAEITGLARSTITLRLELLLESGFIRKLSEAPAVTGGRPAIQYTLNEESRVVLAGDLGASHANVGLFDLRGKLLTRHSEKISISDGPEVILPWFQEEGERLLRSIKRTAKDLIAVGIGLPGPVEHSTGRPINPPIMPGWNGFDVIAAVQKKFKVPVLVDNDVNIMAWGEALTNYPGIQNLMLIKIATGIGAGVVSNGELQRGAQGTAGDIGHIQVSRIEHVWCRCGNQDCLEAVASGPAVAAVMKASGAKVSTGQDVISLLRQGDLQAIQTVRQAGRDIGSVLTACVSLMNPSVIIIGGSMAQAGEFLLAGIREVVYARSMPLATEHLSIVQSELGPDLALFGAAMLAIQHVLSEGSAAENISLPGKWRKQRTKPRLHEYHHQYL